MLLYPIMMADHEEEILLHLKTVDYTTADSAKAHTFLPYDLTIHDLDDEQHIAHPVHVPEMFAYAVVELTTQTTAEGGPTAQLTDATAWVPKQMRRLFEHIDAFMNLKMKTPDWVHDLMAVRAQEAEEQGKATAWNLEEAGRRGAGRASRRRPH